MNWKNKFKNDVNIKLIESKKEFDMYKSTDKLIYLQQAGDKLFSIVENFLMLKYKRRVRSYQQLLQLVSNNRNDTLLLTAAVQLHYFFYNADLQMDRYTAEKLYEQIYYKMYNRLR